MDTTLPSRMRWMWPLSGLSWVEVCGMISPPVRRIRTRSIPAGTSAPGTGEVIATVAVDLGRIWEAGAPGGATAVCAPHPPRTSEATARPIVSPSEAPGRPPCGPRVVWCDRCRPISVGSIGWLEADGEMPLQHFPIRCRRGDIQKPLPGPQLRVPDEVAGSEPPHGYRDRRSSRAAGRHRREPRDGDLVPGGVDVGRVQLIEAGPARVEVGVEHAPAGELDRVERGLTRRGDGVDPLRLGARGERERDLDRVDPALDDDGDGPPALQ